MWDVEGDCGAIYERAGFSVDDVISVRTLCERLLGTRPQFAPIRTEAELVVVNGQWRIFVRRGTSPARSRWLVGHELAEWWLARCGYAEPDTEQLCDSLGAALVAPRGVFLRAWRLDGEDTPKIAKRLKTTESLALLRMGEVTGTPTAVVRHHGALVRGDDFVWPCALELAKAKRLRHQGVRRVEIGDEPRRVGLVGRCLAAERGEYPQVTRPPSRRTPHRRPALLAASTSASRCA